MEYQITLKDLEKAFNFSVEYFLGKSTTSSRTTGQYRGLGSIANDFMIGKVIEIAVASILGTKDKKPVLDFDIHALTEVNRSDPDVVNVVENGIKRAPRVFVEIKVISESDRWVGLTQEQFDTILSNTMASEDPSNIYIIYATLKSKDSDKSSDLLGAYLRSNLESTSLEEFCKPDDLVIEIRHILTGQELRDYGTEFKEGSLMYETDLFNKASQITKESVLDYEEKERFTLLASNVDKLPMITAGYEGRIPIEFGDITVDGEADFIHKRNDASQRLYILCKSEVVIKNEVIGDFHLENGEVYDATIWTLGRSPSLKRNNIWIAQRNLENVIEKSVEERIDEIKEKI